MYPRIIMFYMDNTKAHYNEKLCALFNVQRTGSCSWNIYVEKSSSSTSDDFFPKVIESLYMSWPLLTYVAYSILTLLDMTGYTVNLHGGCMATEGEVYSSMSSNIILELSRLSVFSFISALNSIIIFTFDNRSFISSINLNFGSLIYVLMHVFYFNSYKIWKYMFTHFSILIASHTIYRSATPEVIHCPYISNPIGILQIRINDLGLTLLLKQVILGHRKIISAKYCVTKGNAISIVTVP